VGDVGGVEARLNGTFATRSSFVARRRPADQATHMLLYLNVKSFEDGGEFQLNYNTRVYDETFSAGSADDAATLETIRRTWDEYGYLLDPHTAVGVAVATDYQNNAADDVPMLCVATAHPAKFPDSIAEVLPGVLATHPTLEALAGLSTRKTVLPADVETVKAFIRNSARG